MPDRELQRRDQCRRTASCRPHWVVGVVGFDNYPHLAAALAMRNDITLDMTMLSRYRQFQLIARAAVSVALLGALLTACGKSDNSSNANTIGPVANSNVVLTNTTPVASPKELETESSLAVKRGVITLTAQTRSIRLCGSTVDLTLTDQLDGALDRAYADLGNKPVYAEVYGERGDSQANSKAPSAFNVEELLYATANNPTDACGAQLGTFELQARGSEPNWSIEVHQDTMVFKQTSAPTEIKFTSVETADAEGTVTYRAGVDRHVLELVVTQRACRNAATNEYYAYNAVARLDKQTFNGCARVGE